MQNFSPRAQLYIWATLFAGTLLSIWHLASLRLSEQNVWLLCIISAVAALAQILKVEGATARSSYNISWMAFGFAFVLLGTPAALLVLVVAHLAEWAWHRYPWYIQAFNISAYAVAVSAAGLVWGWINALHTPLHLNSALAILASALVFTFLNHLMVGLIIWLARGEGFAQSGVFGRLTLMIDFTLFGMGAAASLLWVLNPFAIILIVTPLYLIYSVLKVPALQRQTQTDPKTGLFNARYFTEMLEKELARADRFERPLTVAVADMDLLRNINNVYGHLAGDTVLIGVSRILKQSVRDYDVVARFGGEEFAILLPETSAQQALKRIESIRATIEAAQFEVATNVTPIKVTMSFGIAGREKLGQSPTEIVHNADLAVYRAKMNGRNLVSVFSDGIIENVAKVGQPIPPKPEEPVPAAHVQTRAEAAPLPEIPKTELQSPAVPPTQAVKLRPAWILKTYLAGLALAAFGWLALNLPPTLQLDWFGITLFALLVVLTEWLALDVYARDTSVSTSAAPLVAGVLLFGPVGALLFSLLLAGAAMIKHRSPLSRFIFNTGNHLLSGLLCIGVLGLAERLIALPLLVQAGLAAGLVYLSSTWLVSIAIGLNSSQPFRQIWSERFSWLWPYYLTFGIVAYALAQGYLSNGLAGVLTILVPLLMLRFSQTQYLNRTKMMVSQLHATNAEILKRTQEVSALNEGLLAALSHVIDLRDPYVEGHSQHVARYAVLMAQELGLPPERVELVRQAGLLHDIGKLGIPEAILFKPARLTAEEYDLVKQHAVLGAEIIQNIQSLQGLVPHVRYHHEYYDGRGYPDGLRGQQIPVEARILSVADAIEAMASDRPYRSALNAQAILNELRQHASTQFDPIVVDAFCQVVQREGQTFIVNSAQDVNRRISEAKLEKPGEQVLKSEPKFRLAPAV